ncbi:MAG: class II fumarate hydratase, partial [Bacteroidales bacterium]|nr:class II fumarate hydratase [Bacteroidales bacterium]
MSDKYRIEKDTLGEVRVSADKLWGAQTQRSLEHFEIGNTAMPFDIIRGLAIGKKAAACANFQLGVLPERKKKMIVHCCDEIINGELNEHFPLAIWQTGSGTQTNMNVNEVVSNRAEIILKGRIETDNKFLSANDDVNKSQSTNDIFPTAMRIAVAEIILCETIPSIKHFLETIARKVNDFKDIKKIGRTHLMDATPLMLGEEFSGYHSQVAHGLTTIQNALPHLMELPIGGTAVGNGINTPEGYSQAAVGYINQFTNFSFTASENRFEAMASHDSLLEMSGALKRLAVSLMKIANDIRLLSSGPRCGLGEITIPTNEPGSS